MDNARQQIVESIKKGSNILVTVSKSPSVDELSAALGLTIILNNMDKRATAIFSGDVPAAIDFLEPGKTFEHSADSLRDFIIALDKEKADHLRYKVDGDVVKIFITPYKTTLSQSDLEFSQGEFNVDLIIALGVKDQDHLDKALEAHGKILHDATVVTITAGSEASKLGGLDLYDATASSLSEIVVGLADNLKGEGPIFDEQIATALLTGIVSATARFSNDHTTSRAMTMAAQLMAAGANQQLIAAKLEEAHDIAPSSIAKSDPKKDNDENKDSDSELSIDRKDQKTDDKPEEKPEEKSEDKPEKAITDEKTPEVVTPEVKEEVDQKELEAQLAGLTAPAPAESLEDIEKELREAVGEEVKEELAEAPAVTPAPEPTPDPTPTPEPIVAPEAKPESEPELTLDEITLPELPPLPVEEPAVTEPVVPEEPITLPVPAPEPEPQIMNNHGAFAEPPSTVPEVDTVQANPDGELPSVDPFNGPIIGQQGATIMPEANLGTQEGAAVLASTPQPLAPSAPAEPPVGIPQLPPLPPMPSDLSLPPLPPPPPPPPVLGQPPSGAPSGAVAGDIFGDSATAGTATPAPATPPEPGQFKIPGS